MLFALVVLLTMSDGTIQAYEIDSGLSQLDCFSQGVITQSFNPEIEWYCEGVQK